MAKNNIYRRSRADSENRREYLEPRTANISARVSARGARAGFQYQNEPAKMPVFPCPSLGKPARSALG